MSDRSLGLCGVIAFVGLLLGGCASDGAMGIGNIRERVVFR